MDNAFEYMEFVGDRMVASKPHKIKLKIETSPNNTFYGVIILGEGIFSKKYHVYGSIQQKGKFYKMIFAHASNRGHPANTFYYLDHIDHSHKFMKGFYGFAHGDYKNDIKFHREEFMNESHFKKLKEYSKSITAQNHLGACELHVHKLKKSSKHHL